MGTLYFVLKNTAITFILVSLLQIKIGSKTMESRLMNLIRSDFAPMFLDNNRLELNGRSVKFSKEQLDSLKEKIKNSEALKNARAGAKDMLLDEIQKIFNEEEKESEKNN